MPQRPPHLHLIENRDPSAARVHRRMLARSGREPALEFLEGRPAGDPVGAPILFVHGAFGGAWIWSEIVLPLFAARGRHVAAFSLRGHGGSEGHDGLRAWGLQDYLSDLRRALAEMPAPPVVVAHSFGGLLAQMLIGRAEMKALVLMGSLPPEGLFFESARLAVTDPLIWGEAFSASLTAMRRPIVAAGYQLLFSEGLPRERVARNASLMTPESPRALLQAHMPGPVLSAALFRLPALVIGGAADRLVLPHSAARTALYHGGEHRGVEGMGHFLQLDVGAERIAQDVLAWIDERS